MSFKWSNIELKWDPVSFRYINDMIWYIYIDIFIKVSLLNLRNDSYKFILCD